MIVYGQERDAVEIAYRLMEYYGRESCGRCMPCRIATVEMRRIVAHLFHDKAEPDDLERLRVAGETCARLSTCGMGQSFPVPVLAAMRLFPGEFLRHTTPARSERRSGA